MLTLDLHIVSGGYGGFSGGEIKMYINWGDYIFMYQANCQNSSGCLLDVYSLKMKNDVPNMSERMLMDLDKYIVQIDIPTNFIGWGLIDLTIQLFEPDNSEPIFKTTRKVNATGLSLGSVAILTKMKLVRQGDRKMINEQALEPINKSFSTLNAH